MGFLRGNVTLRHILRIVIARKRAYQSYVRFPACTLNVSPILRTWLHSNKRKSVICCKPRAGEVFFFCTTQMFTTSKMHILNITQMAIQKKQLNKCINWAFYVTSLSVCLSVRSSVSVSSTFVTESTSEKKQFSTNGAKLLIVERWTSMICSRTTSYRNICETFVSSRVIVI